MGEEEPKWDVWTSGAKERFLAEGAEAERARIREWAESRFKKVMLDRYRAGPMNREEEDRIAMAAKGILVELIDFLKEKE